MDDRERDPGAEIPAKPTPGAPEDSPAEGGPDATASVPEAETRVEVHAEDAAAGAPIESPPAESSPSPLASSPARGRESEPPARPPFWAEPAESSVDVPRARLARTSRRDFLVFAAGAAAVAAGAFWLLPDGARSRWFGVGANHPLDRMSARVGLSRERRERFLDRALDFDDDVAEALYSPDRAVRTYSTRDITPLRNNYAGGTPTAESIRGWKLNVSGLATGETLSLDVPDLTARFPLHGHVTRFVCVEGWSAVAWFGGVRTADFLTAFPPMPGAKWAAFRSELNVTRSGRPDPYYVSIDLDTLRHPQVLLATHFAGRPLPLAHGAPLRLRAPMKLGLKNIKAITHITYGVDEPPDYWNERGYSRYDGL